MQSIYEHAPPVRQGLFGEMNRSKGKQFRCLQASASSLSKPWGSFADTIHVHEQVTCEHPCDNHSLYLKVNQVPWEDDILWGMDSDVTGTDAWMEEEEEEDDDDDEMNGDDQQQCSSGDVSRRSSDGRVAKTSLLIPSFKDKYPRGTSKSAGLSWVPSSAQMVVDTTTTRQYRWGSIKERRVSAPRQRSDVRPAGQLPCPLNKALDDGSWLNAIGWLSPQHMPESKLVLDENDAAVWTNAIHADAARPPLVLPERKVSSAEARLALVDRQRREQEERLPAVVPLEQSTSAKTSGRKASVLEPVHHSLLAVKLTMVKAELSKAKLRAHHRPRSKFRLHERMTFSKPATHTTGKLLQAKPMVKKSDLHPANGGRLILVEYSEQNPPVLSNPGMASRLVHYYRRPTEDGETTCPPDLPAMGQVISLGPHDATPFIGDVPAGRVVTSLQSSLHKMPLFPHTAIAPFASSEGASELFLLCKTSGPSGTMATTTHSIFEMPDVYLAGQTEPQMQVPAPQSRPANQFIRAYMAFHIHRLFTEADRDSGGRLTIGHVARAFPHQATTAIRKCMKENAIFERGGGGLGGEGSDTASSRSTAGYWRKKANAQSGDELRANLSPESVCMYESMMAGERKLLDIGLTKLTTPKGVLAAINTLLKRLERRKHLLAQAVNETHNGGRRTKENAQRAMWGSDCVVRQLETDIKIARFIHEQLELTPWNLTANYVECHLLGKGVLSLSGMGDPTGRGEGFSFVRGPQLRQPPSTATETAALDGKASSLAGTRADLRKLTMEEAGRVLQHLGFAPERIQTLRRWDRIKAIRSLSNEAKDLGYLGRGSRSGGGGGGLNKFVRDPRKSLSAQQQAYHRKCDAIYARQLAVLQSKETVFSSDDEESNDSEDEDAEMIDALENELLGVGGGHFRTGAEGDTAFPSRSLNWLDKAACSSSGRGSGWAVNRSKEEVEARNEALELQRLRREMQDDDDDDNDSSGASAAASGGGESSRNSSRSSSFSHHSPSPCSTPVLMNERPAGRTCSSRKVIKRTTRVVEADGTEFVRIEFIVDEKQVAQWLKPNKSLPHKRTRANEGADDRGNTKRSRK